MSVDGRFQFRFSGFLGLPLLAVGLFCPTSVFLSGAMNLSVPLDLSFNEVEGVVEVRFLQLAFPDDDDRPALSLKLTPDFLVTSLVPGDLLFPVFAVGTWHPKCKATLMSVPETSMDEYHGLIFREYDVRRAGKMTDVFSIAESPDRKSVV